MRRPTPRSRTASRTRSRLAGAVMLSAGTLILTVVNPAGGSAAASAVDGQGAAGGRTAARNAPAAADGHDHGPPRTKNAISRNAAVTDADTADPTTPRQARAATASAADQRAESEPQLSSVPVTTATHATNPSSRYNMFNACYGLQSTRTGRWLTGTTTPKFTATTAGAAAPLYFKPTTLGRYLLFSRSRNFLDGADLQVAYADQPGPSNDWVVTMPKSGLFKFRVPGRGFLTDQASKARITASGTPLRLRLRGGCTGFPEVTTNVSGRPFSGVSQSQEVRGFIDAHTHGMAFEFLGGDVHCGRPWSPYGVTVALRDCPDPELTGGKGAAMEAFLSGEPSHDPTGWPHSRTGRRPSR